MDADQMRQLQPKLTHFLGRIADCTADQLSPGASGIELESRMGHEPVRAW